MSNIEKKKEEYTNSENARQMVLRTRVNTNGAKLHSKSNIRCHFCRTKDTSLKFKTCSNFQACKHSFCNSCIRSQFSENPFLPATNSWICYFCRGLCNCERCKEHVKEDIDAIKEADGPDLDLDENDQSGDTLYVKEWRKGAMLQNERNFRGPKTYEKSKECSIKRPKTVRKNNDKKFKKVSSEEDGSDYLPNKKAQKEAERSSKKQNHIKRSAGSSDNSADIKRLNGGTVKKSQGELDNNRRKSIG